MTTMTRRAAIGAALATAAAAPAAAAIPAPMTASGDDAELLELGRQLEALYPDLFEANDAYNETQDLIWEKHGEWCRAYGYPGVERETLEQRKAWEEALHRISDECGSKEVSDRLFQDIDRSIDPLFDRVMAMPATTLQGLAVKARAAAIYVAWHLWNREPDELDSDQRAMRSLIEAVCAAAGVSIAEVTDREIEEE